MKYIKCFKHLIPIIEGEKHLKINHFIYIYNLLRNVK